MKLYNPRVESQVVISLITASSEIRSQLLLAIREDHFGFDPAREVFTRVQGVLRTTSADQLPSRDIFLQDPVLGEAARECLRTDVPIISVPTDASALVDILEHFRQTRAMYEGVGKTVDILKSELLDLPKAIVTFEETLLDIRSGVDPLEIFHAGRGDTLEPEVRKLVEQKQTVFIPSGLDSFDSRAGGFTRGDLVVLASHVSGGKTWLMLNMSINEYLKYALNTFVASLEMSREQILGRAIANISSVSHTLIRKGDLQPVYKKDIMQAYQDFKKHGELRGCRFTLHASSRLTPRSLEAMVKPLGYDVIFIDYLNLMQHDTDNNLPLWQRLGEIIRDLKLMALRLNVVIVLATQMGEGDIVRYSRMIKEHADFLWIWKCLDQEKAEGQVKITQDKARNIEQFPFLCGIDFDKGLFGQPSVAGEDLRWKPQGVPSSQVTNVMTELQRSSG